MSDTTRHTRRRYGFGFTALVLAVGLAACGGTPTAVPATQLPVATPATVLPTETAAGVVVPMPATRTPPTPARSAPITGAVAPTTAADAAGGEAAGGDEPTVRYAAPTGDYHFQHPQSWGQTTQPGEGVRFTGRDEFISITIVTTALPPLDYARSDATALATASPGFQGQPPVAATVAGTTEAVVAYTWQLPASAVTGKPVLSAAKRFYIPGPGGKLAVFTYSSPKQTYDPAGADDFANAFAWAK